MRSPQLRASSSRGSMRSALAQVCLLSASAPEATFAPFTASALKLLRDAEARLGAELQPYHVPAELRRCEGVMGRGEREQRVVLTAAGYSASKLRHIRFAEISGGPALQVLNFCIFPELEYGLPTFAADLVTLPGGHLIAIDCQPNALPLDSRGPLARAHARHSSKLPDGGPIDGDAASFFSPYFLWTRLPLSMGAAELEAVLLPAFEEYLEVYVQMVAEASPLTDEQTLEQVRAAQIKYSEYRVEKDPARGMLTRLFGEECTERLIQEVFFDLPLWLQRREG